VSDDSDKETRDELLHRIAGGSNSTITEGPVLECTDKLDCQCWECESARVVNLRTTLIRCIRDGEMNDEMREEATSMVTHSYGTDRWLQVWKMN